MANVGLTVNVGVAAGNVPFTLPSKRNIGLAIESQRGVPNFIYPDIGTLSDYSTYFGGPYNGQFSYYIVKSLFDNAPGVPVTMKVFRIVGTGSDAATGDVTVETIVITMTAGYQGQADPGDWGNSVYGIFYSYGVKVRNAFIFEIYYQGKLMETWQDVTCAGLQNQINQGSGYATVNFSGEVPIGTLSANLTGTITTTTSSSLVTGAASAFTTQLAPGNVLYDSGTGNLIGTIKSIQSATQLTLTGLAAIAETAATYNMRLDFTETIDLTGGVYVTPAEADFYPIPDPTTPQGLAIFDGQDVQLIAVTENHTLTMATQEEEYCEGRMDCIAVLNLPLNSSEALVESYAETLQTTDRAYACGYLEWIQVLDSTGAAITIPELGVALGAGFLTSPYKQGDFIHIPPAGTDGPFTNVQAIVTGLLSQDQVNEYVQQYTVNLSTVSKLYGRYFISSRAYTTSTLWASIHTNLQISYYVRTFLDNLAFVTQKANSPALKKQVIGSLNNFMQGEYDNGSLEQAVPYSTNVNIICDQSNNPLSQDRKILNIEVDYIPPEAVESVIIQLNRNDAVLTATVSSTSTTN